MLPAIRRASSRVIRCAAERRPGSSYSSVLFNGYPPTAEYDDLMLRAVYHFG
jgi:hypothetical protein